MSKTFTITRRNGDRYEVIVDDDRYDEVMRYRWYIAVDSKSKRTYAARATRLDDKDCSHKMYYLHWQISGKPISGIVVDHINGNSLDNRRGNLRHCTIAQNGQNRCINKTTKSGVKGVTWHKDMGKWHVQIGANGEKTHIGYFSTLDSATRAYNDAAQNKHGRYARLNA